MGKTPYAVFAVGSTCFSLFFLKRFHKYFRISTLLRANSSNLIAPAALDESKQDGKARRQSNTAQTFTAAQNTGTLVVVKGEVASSDGDQRKDYVLKQKRVIRVVQKEERTTVKGAVGKRTRPMRVGENMVRSVAAFIGSGVWGTVSSEVTTAKGSVIEEEVSKETEEHPWAIIDSQGNSFKLNMFSLDQSFFHLIQTSSIFSEPKNKSQRASKGVFSTIGFKTVEECLRVGTKLLVIAEVVSCSADQIQPTTLGRLTTGIFDINSILRHKPLLVSTLSEQELVFQVERKARKHLGLAVSFGFGAVCVVLYCLGATDDRVGMEV